MRSAYAKFTGKPIPNLDDPNFQRGKRRNPKEAKRAMQSQIAGQVKQARDQSKERDKVVGAPDYAVNRKNTPAHELTPFNKMPVVRSVPRPANAPPRDGTKDPAVREAMAPKKRETPTRHPGCVLW